MKIFWQGHSCFKIVSGEATIITDPFGPKLGLKPFRSQADIALISHNNPHHNHSASLKGTPFIINGPGEYDIKGVSIKGIPSLPKLDKKQTPNTIFVIDSEEIRLCHLGDLAQKKLNEKQLDAIGEVDILIIPVGGQQTIDAESAVAIINQIEPKLIIPMHYQLPRLSIKLDSVDAFLKEIGMTKQVVDNLTIKKNGLPKEGMQIIVMKIA